MLQETTIIAQNETFTNGIAVSPSVKGSGYHQYDFSQSYMYKFTDFTGDIRLEGTLLEFPGSEDWGVIPNSEFSEANASGSFLITEQGLTRTVDTGTGPESVFIPFNGFGSAIGNYVWVRAVYVVDSGTIDSIRFTF